MTKYDPGYFRILNGFLSLKRAKIFALSQGIANIYINNGFPSNRVFVIPNGVNDTKFRFNEYCQYADRSLYLGKIEPRKNQYLYHNIKSLYFAGPIVDYRYNGSNYLGPFSKDYLYNHLTDFGNLLLSSDGEAHALVCLEALSSGLGIVVSEYAAANLDRSKPFIDVIPVPYINNTEYVESVMLSNRETSISMRNEIRQYALDNFSWENIITKYYIPAINK